MTRVGWLIGVLPLLSSSACAPAAPVESPDVPPESPPAALPTGDSPATTSEQPSATPPEPAVEPEPPPPPRELLPGVKHEKVSFINGEVDTVDGFLKKRHEEIAQCVLENGGMPAEKAHLDMQFLVRARGRAEGVEINGAEGDLSDEAKRCIRIALKNEWVGTPTADPTGVQFRLVLERRLDQSSDKADEGR